MLRQLKGVDEHRGVRHVWGMQVEMIIGLVAVTLLLDFGLEHGRELARRCVAAHRDRRWRQRSRAHWVRWLAHLEAMRESYARDGLPWHVESVEQSIAETRVRIERAEPQPSMFRAWRKACTPMLVFGLAICGVFADLMEQRAKAHERALEEQESVQREVEDRLERIEQAERGRWVCVNKDGQAVELRSFDACPSSEYVMHRVQ